MASQPVKRSGAKLELSELTLGKIEDFLEVIPSVYTRKNYKNGIKKFEKWYGNSITELIKSSDTYSEELMRWYMSDSRGRWKCGEPLPILKNPKEKLLQLLIHPIWWGKVHMKAEERLSEFFCTETKGLKSKLVKTFDAALCAVGLDVRYKIVKI